MDLMKTCNGRHHHKKKKLLAQATSSHLPDVGPTQMFSTQLHVELKQLSGVGSVRVGETTRLSGTLSIRGYHWATGRRGHSNISSQWSRPGPITWEPITATPSSSLAPT